MTNKINGIDVSECEFFQEDGGENTCRAEEDYTGTVVCCSGCDNCYFKQLKRLQQELDIKEKILDKFMTGSGETLEKLQKENEELREEKEELKERLRKYE